MSDGNIYNEIMEMLKTLPPEKVVEAWDFVEFLQQKNMKKKSHGSFTQFCGILSDEDANAMTKAIEEGCERIDYSEW
jgi:hypothetical protein